MNFLSFTRLLFSDSKTLGFSGVLVKFAEVPLEYKNTTALVRYDCSNY